MSFKEKLKAVYKILFKNKPISTLTFGVRVVRCDECQYNPKNHPNCRCVVKPLEGVTNGNYKNL